MSLRTDKDAFATDDICRGNLLGQSIDDLIEGCKPGKELDEKALIGGFSKNLMSCRRFAKGTESDLSGLHRHKGIDRLPSVVTFSRDSLKLENPDAEVVEVQYEDEWLSRKENEPILDAIQNIVLERTALADKLSMAKSVANEREVFVKGSKCVQLPDNAELHVYVSDRELTALGYGDGGWRGAGDNIEEEAKALKRLALDLEDRLQDVPEDVRVRLHLCKDTVNLQDDCDSRCALFSTLYPRGLTDE